MPFKLSCIFDYLNMSCVCIVLVMTPLGFVKKKSKNDTLSNILKHKFKSISRKIIHKSKESKQIRKNISKLMFPETEQEWMSRAKSHIEDKPDKSGNDAVELDTEAEEKKKVLAQSFIGRLMMINVETKAAVIKWDKLKRGTKTMNSSMPILDPMTRSSSTHFLRAPPEKPTTTLLGRSAYQKKFYSVNKTVSPRDTVTLNFSSQRNLLPSSTLHFDKARTKQMNKSGVTIFIAPNSTTRDIQVTPDIMDIQNYGKAMQDCLKHNQEACKTLTSFYRQTGEEKLRQSNEMITDWNRRMDIGRYQRTVARIKTDAVEKNLTQPEPKEVIQTMQKLSRNLRKKKNNQSEDLGVSGGKGRDPLEKEWVQIKSNEVCYKCRWAKPGLYQPLPCNQTTKMASVNGTLHILSQDEKKFNIWTFNPVFSVDLECTTVPALTEMKRIDDILVSVGDKLILTDPRLRDTLPP